ncbi:D-aminoacyl-tRNA deacylase [Geomicrobium sp. JCM 19038]|uniref:D-aminoacyl-tRNA deacylase n=1 Tax=Geomicrobium sp. JCM 19038 TaxID=1460635 RepID=UPI00045F3AAB|nr:D-aminoacyl-tRNA deacylase [Geomicrobium sp. JCM 19038]GAK06356.1 D-tyrosyl-tRNA deacylase [Geomicrobium sp. JCM 19038]
MRVLLQRSKKAQVVVAEETVGQIDYGYVLLVGVTHEDTVKDIEWLAEKIVHLRLFEDDEGKMNHSLIDVGGSVLSVSQFTLYGDAKKGRRPSFTNAARPDLANDLYEQFNEAIKSRGVNVETGVFGAMMDVSLTNDGPVTLMLESPQ